MIDIKNIIDAAADMISTENVKIYKTVCPQDFTRPSFFISATNENIEFEMNYNMTITLDVVITSFTERDLRGDCHPQEVAESARKITNDFASAGGISVDGYFLPIVGIKNEYGMDVANTTIKIRYMDVPDMDRQEHPYMEQISMEFNKK